MERKLYYCEPWPHIKVNVDSQEFEICISPMINGNNEGTTIQFHGIILKSKNVLRIGMLKDGITKEQSHEFIECFERTLRETMSSYINWRNDVYEKGVVKIWYYEENDEEINSSEADNRNFPPLRFAVTVVNIYELDSKNSSLLRNELEKKVIKWLNLICQKLQLL